VQPKAIATRFVAGEDRRIGSELEADLGLDDLRLQLGKIACANPYSPLCFVKQLKNRCFLT